jgi:NAD-dependent deacetylase
MQRVVVLTGAGISAESGIKTFRDSGGLWENYKIEDVATPEAFRKNPDLVLEFYNQRRKQVIDTKPNPAHQALVELEAHFIVNIITQNIDDLHERAGSTSVHHLHGEILKARSTADVSLIYPVKGANILLGDLCEKGSQLRPHIVWFGEAVPMMDKAIELTAMADVLVVIGTSLAVYPAAGLIYYAANAHKKVLIDPAAELPYDADGFTVVRDTAAAGVPRIVKALIENE